MRSRLGNRVTVPEDCDCTATFPFAALNFSESAVLAHTRFGEVRKSYWRLKIV